jgi:hypothetical protein
MNDIIIDFFMLKRLLRSFNTFIGHLNIDYSIKTTGAAIVMRYSLSGRDCIIIIVRVTLTSYSVKIKVPFWLFEVLGE